MEEDHRSPRVSLCLYTFPATSSAISELRLFVLTASTSNPQLRQFAGQVTFQALRHQLSRHEAARKAISEMLSCIDPAIRIHLEPYCERISSFTWQSSRTSPGGLIEMLAELRVYNYTSTQTRWALKSDYISTQTRWALEWDNFMRRYTAWWFETVYRGEVEEEEEVDQGSMVSFDEAGFQGVPATKEAIKKLDKLIYRTAGEEVCCQAECVVCMEDFTVGAEVSKMPCSHAFHQICLEKWLNQSHQCPLCRFALPMLMDTK